MLRAYLFPVAVLLVTAAIIVWLGDIAMEGGWAAFVAMLIPVVVVLALLAILFDRLFPIAGIIGEEAQR